MISNKTANLNTVMVTEVITAAWKLYREQGWADRANRTVVYDPIYAADAVQHQNVNIGDVIVPSLYTTVRNNVIALCPAYASVNSIPLSLPLEITGDIRAAAEVDRDIVINDNVMRTLQDDQNEFRSKVAAMLHSDAVALQDLKTLCYITTMADSVRDKSDTDAIMDRARNTVLAPVNHTVDVAVQILSSRYNQNWSTYNHTAITDDGCMVSFFQKTKIEPMHTVRITAKVKTHGRVWNRPDLAETRLNYVKIVNDLKRK